jgi:hypothetical protein
MTALKCTCKQFCLMFRDNSNRSCCNATLHQMRDHSKASQQRWPRGTSLAKKHPLNRARGILSRSSRVFGLEVGIETGIPDAAQLPLPLPMPMPLPPSPPPPSPRAPLFPRRAHLDFRCRCPLPRPIPPEPPSSRGEPLCRPSSLPHPPLPPFEPIPHRALPCGGPRPQRRQHHFPGCFSEWHPPSQQRHSCVPSCKRDPLFKRNGCEDRGAMFPFHPWALPGAPLAPKSRAPSGAPSEPLRGSEIWGQAGPRTRPRDGRGRSTEHDFPYYIDNRPEPRTPPSPYAAVCFPPPPVLERPESWGIRAWVERTKTQKNKTHPLRKAAPEMRCGQGSIL